MDAPLAYYPDDEGVPLVLQLEKHPNRLLRPVTYHPISELLHLSLPSRHPQPKHVALTMSPLMQRVQSVALDL